MTLAQTASKGISGAHPIPDVADLTSESSRLSSLALSSHQLEPRRQAGGDGFAGSAALPSVTVVFHFHRVSVRA